MHALLYYTIGSTILHYCTTLLYCTYVVYYCMTLLRHYLVPLMPIPAASAGDHRDIARTATASCPLCYCLNLLQVTTGSDVYSFGVLMWSLYMGQQPYVVRSGVLFTNPLFPHFPTAGHAAHPQYTYLAERCLRRDPHERPSFAEITDCLLDFFTRQSVAPGPPQAVPPTVSRVVPGPHQPPPATSSHSYTVGSDGLIISSGSQLSYVDSRCLLASCVSPAAGTHQDAGVQALAGQQQQQHGAEVQALIGQQQQGAEVQALLG